MNPLESPAAAPGLRERKKQQTRDAIRTAALRLFAQRGYDETTLADIAEAAGIAPRTIFAYFDSKEDILLCEEMSFLTRLRQELEQRPPGTTTVDVIREFLSSIGPPDEEAMLRKKIVTANPALEMRMRARHAELEPMLARSIARDLDSGPDDIRPLLVAASITTAFMSVSERLTEAQSMGQPLSHEEGMAVLDQVLEFLRGGLEALQRG
jgi:AcrR family transcriptional regulator